MKFSKFIMRVFLIMTVATTSAPYRETRTADLTSLMQRPLIVGASVSADHSSLSPGKQLALQYTDQSNIKTLAYGGRPGHLVLTRLEDRLLTDRSIVIGVDLFFWDSIQASPAASLQALHRLMNQVSRLGIPIVLGKIPELIPAFQPSRHVLNEAIENACMQYDRCYILPFDEYHRQLLREGTLPFNKRRYTYRELMPDGLHVGNVGGAYLAQKIEEILSARQSYQAGA